MIDTIKVPKYVTLTERLYETQQELEEKKTSEMHADKTTVISAEHPLAIAAEKALEDYRNGKTLTTEQMIQRLLDELDEED